MANEQGFGGLWGRMKSGLQRTRDRIMENMDHLLDLTEIDDAFYEDLEATLIQTDMGMAVTEHVLKQLKTRVTSERLRGRDGVFRALGEILAQVLDGDEADRSLRLESPLAVILVVGVNGVGKTTTAAKLAHQLKAEGRVPILGAVDTFRAAAIDQLQIWGERAGVDVIAHAPGADPAAVAFDTIKAAIARSCDVVILDTAGRLHNRKNLMDELGKIHRIVGREVPEAPHETLLVLDATTGQNALRQAEIFQQVVAPTGVVLTKLDGTAKGGIIFAVEEQTGVRVKFVGLGETLDDLQAFETGSFIDALLGLKD